MDAVAFVGAKNFRLVVQAKILQFGVEIVLLDDIRLGLTWIKEAHHQEGHTWSWKGIGLGLEVLEFVI